MKRSITFLFPFFLILLCSFKIETFQWAYDAQYKIISNNNCESYNCQSSSPLLVPNFKFYFGGANADYFTKVITHGGDYYAIGNSAGRASLTRISNAGNVLWTRELSITSAWNDLIITTNNEILLVGINGNYDNNAKSLIGTCTLGGIMNIKSYNYSNRESLTKIYLNPNPENPSFPYYIIGVSNSGGSSQDDILIINANSIGAINWSKNIYNQSQDFEFYRDISIQSNSGDMVLIGNNLGKAAMVQINKSGTVINGLEFNENMRFNTIVSNSTPIAGYNHLLGGSNNVTTVAQLMKVNGLSTILYNYKVDSLDAITKIISKPGGGYYALGRGTIRGANRSVVLSLSEVGNSLTLDWSKTLSDNSSLYNFGYIGLMNSTQIAFTEGRQNAINGFGSTDGFISIDNLDFENCLTLKLNLKLSPLNSTNTTFFPSTINLATPTPSILNANSPTYNQKNVCAFVCNVRFEIQPGNCGIIQFFPSTNQTGTLSYCWDFGDNPPCGSVIQNPIHQYQNNGSYTVCVTIKDGVNSCEDCKIINVSSVDNQAPNLNCPQDITISCKQSILPIVTGNPFVSDNLDPSPVISYTDQIVSSSPCDTSIKRTWLVIDRCNNKKSCTQFIAKKDNIKPNIICPADITIDCQFVPSILLTGNATASDDCQSQIVISYTDQLVNNLPCGSIITRTFSAADICGNKSTCVQKITKRDIEKPKIQCPNNFTINCNEQNPSPTKYGYPTATDNCQMNSNIQFSYADKLIGTLPCPNKLERSWFALDSCGNSASCLQVFNLEAPKTIHFSEILATMDSSGISGELHEIISCGSYARIFCKPNNSWEKGKSKYILNFEGDLLVSVGGISKIQWKLYSDPKTLINDGKLTISENEDHFKFEALKISELIPKNIYTLNLTGFHEKDSMNCSLTFSIEDLLPISIDFSNIKLSTSINGLPSNNEISATCGSFNSLRIPIWDTFPENIIVRGDLIVNEDSLSSIWWKLLDSNNIVVNQGKVIIPENSDTFYLVAPRPLKQGTSPSQYRFELIGRYQNDSAICNIHFALAPSEICCTDTSTLRTKLESALIINYDHEFCQANIVINDLPNSCNINVVSISWGDGTREKGSFSNGDVLTHTYFPNDKTYIIKLNVLEYDTNDNICNSIQIKKNILTDCDDCSELVDIQLYNKKFEKPVVCDSAGFKHLIPTGENYFNISGKIICSKTNTKFIDYKITDLDSANFIIQGTAKTDTDNIWDIENLLFSDFNLSHNYLVEIDTKCKSKNCKCSFQINFFNPQSNCQVKIKSYFTSLQQDPDIKIGNIEIENCDATQDIKFIGITDQQLNTKGVRIKSVHNLIVDGALKDEIWNYKSKPENNNDFLYPPARDNIKFSIKTNETDSGNIYIYIIKTDSSTCVIPIEWTGKLFDPLPVSITNIPVEIDSGYTLAVAQFQIHNNGNPSYQPKYCSIGMDTVEEKQIFAISGSIFPLDSIPKYIQASTMSLMGTNNVMWEISDEKKSENNTFYLVYKIKKGNKKNVYYSYTIYDKNGKIIGKNLRNKLKVFSNLTTRKDSENIELLTNNELELLDYYPNPTKDKLTIKYKQDKLTELTLSIIDLQGQLINTFKINSKQVGQNSYELDIKNINAGFYIIDINDSNHQISFPIEIIN